MDSYQTHDKRAVATDYRQSYQFHTTQFFPCQRRQQLSVIFNWHESLEYFCHIKDAFGRSYSRSFQNMWKIYMKQSNTEITVKNTIYRQVSNTRRTLVGKNIFDHSNVVGASPFGAAPKLHLHSPLNTWFQYIAQRQVHAKTRNIYLFGFGASYIRYSRYIWTNYYHLALNTYMCNTIMSLKLRFMCIYIIPALKENIFFDVLFMLFS